MRGRATPFDFEGEHYKVAGATVRATPPSPTPEIFFGGASPAGREVAAAQADIYLTWTEPPAQVAELHRATSGSARSATVAP